MKEQDSQGSSAGGWMGSLLSEQQSRRVENAMQYVVSTFYKGMHHMLVH